MKRISFIPVLVLCLLALAHAQNKEQFALAPNDPMDYNVYFNCPSSCPNAFNGWWLIINGDTLTSGQSIILSGGTWSDTICWLGCMPVYGTLDLFNDLEVDCSFIGFIEPHVTFHVSSGSGNIENATVIVESYTLITNSSGDAYFCLPGGGFSFMVEKEGYDTVSGNFNYMDFCSDTTVEILLDPVLVESIHESGIQVVPNPSEGKFYLENSLLNDEPLELSVTDLTGRLLCQKTVNLTNKIEIDLGDKPKGMYFLQVKIENKTLNRKIIIR